MTRERSIFHGSRRPATLRGARPRVSWLLAAAALLALTPGSDAAPGSATEEPRSTAAQRELIIELLARELHADAHTLERVRTIFSHSPILGQGNPDRSVHPMSRAECEARRRSRPLQPANLLCGAAYMVPLYHPERERHGDGRVCIDQFEFPNVPCQYPVVHVRANEAAALCEALGKRLCDAHEWEGACAGELLPPDTEYVWGQDRATMRTRHNAERRVAWAYGPSKNHALCATNSRKSPGCPGSGFAVCGSNTLPTGSFPECVSAFGVYDLHGNVAEHMSLPLSPRELGSAGGHGSTEMKGSWFVFGQQDAHPDDCRWRAPNWHGSRVTDPGSHSNYHLGFRCCKDL